MQRQNSHAEAQFDRFATDVAGLPLAGKPEMVDLAPGDSFELRIHPVAKNVGTDVVRMLSYNGSIPGPTLRVQQGSEVVVDVANEGDLETTVHWHGLRLANRYDGVPHQTQSPIPIGGRYSHRLTFPDAGLFWYHPHIREDFAQEMGLYGNVEVAPSDPDYWPPADRAVLYTLDDVLIEDGVIAPFSRRHSDHIAMGRYGNVLLVAGETEQKLEVRRNEVIRFGLTNAANTRVFKVALPGLPMKLVGGDGGAYEREEFLDHVVISPSERSLIDVRFDRAGDFALTHVTPDRTYSLVNIAVSDEDVRSSAADKFSKLRTTPEMAAERRRIARHLEAPPDKTLALVAEMDFDGPSDASVVYACPMHPEVTSDLPGNCPKCGMKLMPVVSEQSTYTCPMHPEVTSDQPGKCPECGMKLIPVEGQASGSASPRDHLVDATPAGHQGAHQHGGHGTGGEDGGIEWEDLMAEVNRGTTPANMRWKFIDRETGKENAEIDWTFSQGDQVKIRLVNEMESDHPMHHPFHIHGQRFLVLTRDGVEEPNLVWKDTVLITTGQTVDILMDGSNPGLWMAHCHIAEHNEAGMMFSFRVDRQETP